MACPHSSILSARSAGLPDGGTHEETAWKSKNLPIPRCGIGRPWHFFLSPLSVEESVWASVPGQASWLSGYRGTFRLPIPKVRDSGIVTGRSNSPITVAGPRPILTAFPF